MNRLYHKMLKFIDRFMSKRYIPSWFISLIDSFIILISIIISGVLLSLKEIWFNFPFDHYSIRFIIITFISINVFLHLFRINKSVIRYSSFSDMLRILLAILIPTILLLIVNLIYKFNVK
jgi:FlaA1/EpsC-like NDP-sugar epimerase